MSGKTHPVTAENFAQGTGTCSAFSDPVFSKLARINGDINRMPKDQLRMKLAELNLNTGGVKEVLKKRLKSYYKRKKLAAANIIKGAGPVPYDFLVVIDFEATCQESNDNFVHEIIEFPGVLIDMQQKKIIGVFHEFCKPVLNPVLSDFCRNLTGIQQAEVDSACLFHRVLELFEKWLSTWGLGTQHSFCVVTDGPWDIQRFLSLQCQISQLPIPRWGMRWVNIRRTFSNFYDTGRVNLRRMLEHLGLQFEGRPHCGLDDAKNIAHIVCHMIEDGSELRANERLSNDLPCLSKPQDTESGSGRRDHKLQSQETVVHAGGVCASSTASSVLGLEVRMNQCSAVSQAESEEDISDLLYYFSLQST